MLRCHLGDRLCVIFRGGRVLMLRHAIPTVGAVNALMTPNIVSEHGSFVIANAVLGVPDDPDWTWVDMTVAQSTVSPSLAADIAEALL